MAGLTVFLDCCLRIGQDLKDFARTAGEVTFADCHKEAEGVG